MANPLTISRVSSSANLIPPFAGPLALECWTLKPVKVLVVPSSISTGIRTINSLSASLINSLKAGSSPKTSAL
ncbi:hypothetical protein ES705_19180 [subsurface metagenome]